jgi:signal transduction histidine kinase
MTHRLPTAGAVNATSNGAPNGVSSATTPASARTRRGILSLHAQVALVIAVLSFLPNLVMALMIFIPEREQLGRTDVTIWLPLVVWVVGVVLLSACIGYLLSRQLLRPLRQLGGQIQALKRTPDKLARAKLGVDSREPRETLALKTSFNGLISQVALEQSRRNSFMATLVHDLKTPLVAANHLLAVIRDTDSMPREERVELVGQLLDENSRLLELVQKMVDAHKFEREEVVLKRQVLPLKPLVQGVCERLRPLARERQLRLEIRGDAQAQVDPRELERALYNLLGNAVRYARSAILVEIYAGVIRLSDDGPGLPRPIEELAQPFNAQPVDIAGKRYTAGTGGLGMFIARRIIEAHGGRLVTEVTGPTGTVLLIYYGQAQA